MKRKWVAMTTLLIVLIISLMGCGKTPQYDIVNNPMTIEEFSMDRLLSEMGSIDNSFNPDETKISYDNYYWDEETIEYGMQQYLNRIVYYDTYYQSGTIEDGDGAVVLATIMLDNQILSQENIEIYKDLNTEEWYSPYYNDIVNKKVGDILLKSYTHSDTSLSLKEDWMVNGETYAISLKITQKITKANIELTDETVEYHIVPMIVNSLGQPVNFTTVSEFKEYMKEEATLQVAKKNKNNIYNGLSEYINDFVENVTLNEDFIQAYTDNVTHIYFVNDAKLENLTLEEYESLYCDTTLEQYEYDTSYNILKIYMGYVKIAKDLGITLTKEDELIYLDSYLEKISKLNESTIEEERETYEKYPYGFYMMLLQNKVTTKLNNLDVYEPNNIKY